MGVAGFPCPVDGSELIQREYRFGIETLHIYSRKYTQDTNNVSIAMQVSVEQIWVSA